MFNSRRRPFFWEILLVAIGLAESYRVAVGWAQPRGSGLYQLADDYEPGDLGFDPLGLRPEDPEAFKTMQTKELNNGRLAMIAIAGFVAQELVVKREIFEHLATYLADVVVEDVVQPAEKAVGIPLTQPPQPLPAEPTIPPNVSEIFR